MRRPTLAILRTSVVSQHVVKFLSVLLTLSLNTVSALLPEVNGAISPFLSTAGYHCRHQFNRRFDLCASTNQDCQELQSALHRYCSELIPNSLQSGTEAVLRPHQGFPFSLDCAEWNSSGYTGSIHCWSAVDQQRHPLHWLSVSSFTKLQVPTMTSTVDSSVGGDRSKDSPLWSTELHAYTASTADIPHLKISLSCYRNIGDDGIHTCAPYSAVPRRSSSSSSSGDECCWLKLRADFVPRSDLMADAAYFDKYFAGLDEEFYQKGVWSTAINTAAGTTTVAASNDATKTAAVTTTSTGTVTAAATTVDAVMMPSLLSPSALDRLVTSAFSTSLWIENKSSERALAICDMYVQKWIEWLLSSEVLCVANEREQSMLTMRDRNVKRLLFDHSKFAMARVLGADFAPKADSIAASLLGPPT